MPESQYEYNVTPFSLAPSELENAKVAFNDVLNDLLSWLSRDRLCRD